MVISAEPPPPPPPDPVADAAAVEAAAAATSNPRKAAAFSSFPSLKTWGSHRALRCAHINHAGAGDAIATATATAAARRSPEKLDVGGEKAPRHLNEAEAGSSDAADADHVAAEEAPEPVAAASQPWKLRTRRRPKPPVPSARPSSPPERRPSRARAEVLDRPRFYATLTSEEIEEDIYAFTGARPRRRPKRRPRAVQKQLDMLFPGSWLSEITAETYRVPDDR
nr:unnamed protein product [Digitaria exilis]